mgnify:CR=1 FL=1
MTLGDASAGLVGRTWGVRKYQNFGHTRTYLGSATMAAVWRMTTGWSSPR